MRAELLVVGAGPAGVSAALWARALELDVLLLDGAPAPGGQLHAVNFHPQDVPGFEQGDGPALAAAYARQLPAASVPLRPDCLAIGIRSAGGHTAVELPAGERLEAPAGNHRSARIARSGRPALVAKGAGPYRGPMPTTAPA